VRSSPISIFTQENLPHWLALSPTPPTVDFAPDTMQVLEALAKGGALFFRELVKRTGLLPSRVEQALGELTAQGWATADSFEGLRALIMPQDKRIPLHTPEHRRHHKGVTNVEYAGRWSLLRVPPNFAASGVESAEPDPKIRDDALDVFARALLRRYGIVFRRLLERESLRVSWFELGRLYRRLEARGEIRGGFFVSGVSGEQFARPEAIGLLRSIRKKLPSGELMVISGADPLNLTGILTPGPRVPGIAGNRILFTDGVPTSALSADQIISLTSETDGQKADTERLLRVGSLPSSLRGYYS
jgi:ATP-dependent Lhr-like helicase